MTVTHHATCGDVEARSNGDDIKLIVLPVSSLDAGLSEGCDAVARLERDIDNVNIRTIELLVVVLLEAGALDSEWMRRLERTEKVTLSRIMDASTLLLGPEIVGFAVGLVVVEIVGEVSEPERNLKLSTHALFGASEPEKDTHSRHAPKACDRTCHALPSERQKCISHRGRSRTRRSISHGRRRAPGRMASACSAPAR